MSQPSQLTYLIWDFYREEWVERERLQVLRNCKIWRRWGVFRIECPDDRTAEDIIGVLGLIEAPVKQLRLAKQIKVFCNRELCLTHPTPLKQISAR